MTKKKSGTPARNTANGNAHKMNGGGSNGGADVTSSSSSPSSAFSARLLGKRHRVADSGTQKTQQMEQQKSEPRSRLFPSVKEDTWLFLLWISSWLAALTYYFSDLAPLPFSNALISLLNIFVEVGEHVLGGMMGQQEAKEFSLRLSPLAVCLVETECSPLRMDGDCVRSCLQGDITAVWVLLLVYMASMGTVLVRIMEGVHYVVVRLLGGGAKWHAVELLPRPVGTKLVVMMLPPLMGFLAWNGWHAALRNLPTEATPALWLVVVAYVVCLMQLYLTLLVVSAGGYSFLKGLTLISISLGAATFDFRQGNGTLAEVGGRGARVFAYSCILEQSMGLVLTTVVAGVELLRALYSLLTGHWRTFLQLLRLPLMYAITIIPLLAAQEWIARQMSHDLGYPLHREA